MNVPIMTQHGTSQHNYGTESKCVILCYFKKIQWYSIIFICQLCLLLKNFLWLCSIVSCIIIGKHLQWNSQLCFLSKSFLCHF